MVILQNIIQYKSHRATISNMTTQLKESGPPVVGTYSILTQISYHHVVLEFAETLSYIPPPPLRCHAHLTSHVASSNQLVPHIKRTSVDMKEGFTLCPSSLHTLIVLPCPTTICICIVPCPCHASYALPIYQYVHHKGILP